MNFASFRKSERRHIAQHAGTVLVGQLAVISFGVADTVVAGRYAEDALAALSVGAAIFISVFITLMGALQALLPIWAEMHGASQKGQLGASARQSLYLCLVLTLLGMVILFFPQALIRWAKVPAELQGLVRSYLAIVALSLPAGMVMRIYNTINQALGRPQMVTWLQLFSIFVKIPLTVWFAFGGLGLEPMGVWGLAWATVVDNYVILIIAIVLMRKLPFYAAYNFWRRPERVDWREQRQFLRLGIPAGLSIMVETTSFTLMALLVARQGVVALAAHQIAANVAAVLYMLPLSMGIATSARVGFWLGRAQHRYAHQTVRMGFQYTWLMVACVMLFFFVGRGWIAALYSSDAAVVALASVLLLGVNMYHLGDAMQVFCVFLLRCWRITVAPMLIYTVMLWGVGLGGGFWLAYHGPVVAWHSPMAFWLAGALAQGMTAAVFVWMLLKVVRTETAK